MATVMIVDDEQCLAKTIGVYLEESGHLIFQCASPESACEQFTEANGAVDLILTDVALGITRCLEIGLEMRRRSPKLKLLFAGYNGTGDRRLAERLRFGFGERQ